MDQNQRTGLLLIFILLAGWIYFTKPSEEEIQRQQAIQDSIALAQQPVEEAPTGMIDSLIPDSIKNIQLSNQFGSFAIAASGTNETFELDNNLLNIQFNSKGGFIASATLSGFNKIVDDEEKNEVKQSLKLLEDDKNRMNIILPIRGVGNINLADLYFQGQTNNNVLVLQANAGNGMTIQKKYTLNPESYQLDYELNLIGVGSQLQSGTEAIDFKFVNYLDRIEKNYTFEKYYSTTYFKQVDKDSDYCTCRGDAEETPKKDVEWFSNANQFFNTTLIAENQNFTNTHFETIMSEEDSEDLKKLVSKFSVPISGSNNEKIAFSYYIGPNDFKTLSAYENGMDEIIPFGRSLFGTINRWVIRPSFDFLSKYIGSKGIVIIVLIFILKMLLYPLMYKMLHSQAKMAALKPELAQLKDKHKDDPQQAQMETMKVYREYGVSPLGGCFPMLLQMPIWYALFRFFPASLTFRQESFLWATDLSSYDSIMNLPFTIPAFGSHISLFTILWALSTVAYTYYNSKHLDMSANPAMKYVQYFMPLMFLFFFNNYASGLTCYMLFSNLFNIGQTLATKKFIFDEEKIREELFKKREEEKKKPKKKNGFQQRLEEAMKQQQQIQKQRDAAKKNKRKK